MRVFVNDIAVDLLPGMTVRHALIAAYGTLPDPGHILVNDRWGNHLGLDGALSDHDRIESIGTGLGDMHG